MQASSIRPVILSGGSGTRLWPLSSPARPKQFLALAGDHSMIQETALRVSDGDSFLAPVVVASARHCNLVRDHLLKVDVTPDLLILEPVGRNTAAAVALAALCVEPSELLLILPSDHQINDASGFVAAVQKGANAAQEDWIVTFGVVPTRADVGFGYIEPGGQLGPGVHRVSRFHEKPDQATADAYFAGGSHLWNAGIFLCRAGAMIDELECHAPHLLSALRRSLLAARREQGIVSPDEATFEETPALSIDIAVIERSDKVATVPLDVGWSDLGSWDALHEALATADRNVGTEGPVIAIDCSDSLIYADGIKVTAIGVQDLLVIATAKEILLVPRGSSPRVNEAGKDPGGT